ncbi:MAG: PSP1 domain-containing protein [Planctomycetota bacterium]|jgi:cell fate regulator YaaT (PSP1 superfamily)
MSIVPLPVFEADADPQQRTDLTDEEVYERLEPPKTIVVRFGAMRLIGEDPYSGDAKPGCGSRLVARTHRGTEVVEMLTTTCGNSGCGKSVSRSEILDYIDNSGGRDFPFYTKGRVLRVATIEDLNAQSALDSVRREAVRCCKAEIADLGLDMKLVEVEPILGGELLGFYYMSEKRIDFRELVRRLAAEFKTRIEMRQVGARDEARLVADYERCGEYCCCKNFLKVLKPVSMRSAKLQKATLDPLKISGRCGRLMCCLRYEDHTYKELKARLPKKGTRVGTREGPGAIVDSKLLVQLVLVRLEHDASHIAVPIEELMDPDECPDPTAVPPPDPLRGLPEQEAEKRTGQEQRRRRRRRRGRAEADADAPKPAAPRSGRGGGRGPKPAAGRAGAAADGKPPAAGGGDATGDSTGEAPRRRRRRRRRRRGGGGGKPSDGGGGGGDG